MGTNSSKIAISTPRQGDTDSPVELSSSQLHEKPQSRFQILEIQLKEISKMKYKVKVDSNMRTLLTDESGGEGIESHRASKTQIKMFYNIFKQDEDNYIAVDLEGYLVCRNTNKPQDHGIVFRGLKLSNLPDDLQDSFNQIIRTQMALMPQRYGGLLPDQEEGKESSEHGRDGGQQPHQRTQTALQQPDLHNYGETSNVMNGSTPEQSFNAGSGANSRRRGDSPPIIDIPDGDYGCTGETAQVWGRQSTVQDAPNVGAQSTIQDANNSSIVNYEINRSSINENDFSRTQSLNVQQSTQYISQGLTHQNTQMTPRVSNHYVIDQSDNRISMVQCDQIQSCQNTLIPINRALTGKTLKIEENSNKIKIKQLNILTIPTSFKSPSYRKKSDGKESSTTEKMDSGNNSLAFNHQDIGIGIREPYSSQQTVSTVDNQINQNIKQLRQRPLRPPNLKIVESQNSSTPEYTEISTSIIKKTKTVVKRDDLPCIQSDQAPLSDPSHVDIDSSIMLNSQNMSSIGKIGRNFSDTKQNESQLNADRVLGHMTNKKGGILSSCTMDTPEFINNDSHSFSPQKDLSSNQVSPDFISKQVSSDRFKKANYSLLKKVTNEAEMATNEDIDESNVAQELRERFRIAIFGDNPNMKSHDKDTAEMVKNWMTNIKTAKHKRIIENTKEEKKDGLSSYYDQKKKLANYKSAFRSAKNIDFGLHNVQNSSELRSKKQRKMNRVNSNDDCQITQETPYGTRKKASLNTKTSPPKKNENGDKNNDLLNTQKNTNEDSFSRQLNCSEQNSPLYTQQNDLIGAQELDLELKNCSIQNSEARIQEAELEEDLDEPEQPGANTSLAVKKRRSSIRKIEKELNISQNLSVNQDQISSEKSQENSKSSQLSNSKTSSFQSRPSSFHQKRQIQSGFIQITQLDPTTAKSFQNVNGIEEEKSSSSEPGDYANKEKNDYSENDEVQQPTRSKFKSGDISAIVNNLEDPLRVLERRRIKQKSRSGRNLSSEHVQSQMSASGSNELTPVSNRILNQQKRRTQYTKQTKSIEMPKRRRAQLKSTKSEDLIFVKKPTSRPNKRDKIAINKKQNDGSSKQYTKQERIRQFKRSVSMIYRIIDSVIVPTQKRHEMQLLSQNDLNKKQKASLPKRLLNIQKASSNVKIESNNSESYNSSPLPNDKDSGHRSVELPSVDQINFSSSKNQTMYRKKSDVMPHVINEIDEHDTQSFQISELQIQEIQLKKIHSAQATQNFGQYKKLLSLNTVQEENKEYDQSSVCHSIKGNSVYQSEKINKLIKADIKRQYINAKNRLGTFQNNENKGQKDKKRFFGRQKTQNLSESKNSGDKILSHGIQQMSQFVNSQAGNQKSLDMNSVQSEGQLSRSSYYKAESQNNKYNPQIFASSIVSNNVNNQLSPLLPKGEKREKDSENSRTSSRLHDKASSIKNAKKKTNSTQNLINVEQESQGAGGESMSINSKFSHQNQSIKQSSMDKNEAGNEGQNVTFESKLVRQKSQSDCNCKDGVFSPESQLSGHIDNIQIQIKQLDKLKESRKKILKMRINNNQIISSNQYIYTHDYKPLKLPYPQDKRPVDGQNLIKNVQIISKKLKIKDKQKKLPIIFQEIKRNQITRTMLMQQKTPFPIKKCEDLSSETNTEMCCQHQQLTNQEIEKYYLEKANTTAVNRRPNLILDSNKIFYENYNQIWKNKSTNVSPNAAKEAILLSDQLTSGFIEDEDSFIENLMENYGGLSHSKTISKISTSKSKKTTSKKSTSKSNEINQNSQSQFKKKSENSSLTKDQQQSIQKPSIENSEKDYFHKLAKPHITRNVSEIIKQKPHNSSISSKSQAETVFTPTPFKVGNIINNGQTTNAFFSGKNEKNQQARANLHIVQSKSEMRPDNPFDATPKEFGEITSYDNIEDEQCTSEDQEEKDDLESSEQEYYEEGEEEDQEYTDGLYDLQISQCRREGESSVADGSSMKTSKQYGKTNSSIDGQILRLNSSISGTPSKRSKKQSYVVPNSFNREDYKQNQQKAVVSNLKDLNEKESEFEFNGSIKSKDFSQSHGDYALRKGKDRRNKYMNKCKTGNIQSQDFIGIPQMNQTAKESDKQIQAMQLINQNQHNSQNKYINNLNKTNINFNNQLTNFISSSNETNRQGQDQEQEKQNLKNRKRQKPPRANEFKENLMDHTPKSAQVTKNDEIRRNQNLISSQDNSKAEAASVGQIKSYSNDKFSPSSPTIFQKNGDDSKTPYLEDLHEEDQDFSKQMKRMQQQLDNDQLYDNNTPMQKANSFNKIKDEPSNCLSPMTQDGAFPQIQNEEQKDLKYIKNKVDKTGFKTPGHNQLGIFNIKRISTHDDRFSSQQSKLDRLQSQLPYKEMDFLTPNSPSRKQKKKNFYPQEETKFDPTQNRHRSQGGCSSPSGTSQCSSINHHLTQYTISTSSCISKSKKGKKVINQYELFNEIGKGQFASVFKIRDINTKQFYAMKVINKQQLKKKMMAPKKSQFNMVEKEIAIMKKMGHPHIVKLIEVIDDPNHNKQFLVQEYIPSGDLQALIAKSVDSGPKLQEQTMRMYFRQLMCAVWYCHEVVGIIHRDIKPDNILIDSDNNIKLTDFGVSDTFQQKKVHHHHHLPDGSRKECSTRHDNAGSYCYYCPEACSGGGYSGEQADIWACGITLYQMVFGGKLPFVSKQNNIKELYAQILNDEPEYNQVDIKADIENKDTILTLIQSMLQKDPKQRISMVEMQDHPWITNFGKQPCNWATEVQFHDFEKPTDEEVKMAMTKINELKNMIFKRVGTSIHSQMKQQPRSKFYKEEPEEQKEQKKQNSKKKLKEDKPQKEQPKIKNLEVDSFGTLESETKKISKV